MTTTTTTTREMMMMIFFLNFYFFPLKNYQNLFPLVQSPHIIYRESKRRMKLEIVYDSRFQNSFSLLVFFPGFFFSLLFFYCNLLVWPPSSCRMNSVNKTVNPKKNQQEGRILFPSIRFCEINYDKDLLFVGLSIFPCYPPSVMG